MRNVLVGKSDCEHITQVISLESAQFPFNIFDAYGSSGDNVYLHNHDCLEINYAAEGTGTYYIGELQYPIQKGDLFIINNCEYHIAVREKDLLLESNCFCEAGMVWRRIAVRTGLQISSNLF